MELFKKIEGQIKRLVAAYPADTILTEIVEELINLNIKREQITIAPVGHLSQFYRSEILSIDYQYDNDDLVGIVFQVNIEDKIRAVFNSLDFDCPLMDCIKALERIGFSKDQINVVPGGSLNQFSLKDIELIDRSSLIEERGVFKQLVLRIKTQNWIEELIESYPIDISAEVIVAELIEQGMDPKQIEINPRGLFKRFYNKDIAGVDFDYDETNDILSRVTIGVNREGIYDSLPQFLFHQPAERKSFKSKEHMKSESSVLREEELHARMFFRPIEQAIYHHRVMLELEERETIRNFTSDEIKAFWDLPDFLEEEVVLTLLFLLPTATRIVGNPEIVALCLQAIIGQKVEVKVNNGSSFAPKEIKVEGIVQGLGMNNLGVNTVVGSGSFMDLIPSVSIDIGNIPKEHIVDFLPGGKKQVLLEWVKEYFFPVEWDLETNILINYDEFRPAKLGSPSHALGYSFVI